MSTSSLMSPLPRVAAAATFPVEVEEGIIDKLHYHIHALQNCALACRRWLPRTRYHLFAAIRVRTKDELNSLSTLLSRFPHLLPLVRSLTLRAELNEPETASLPDGACLTLDLTFELGMLEVLWHTDFR